MVEQARNTSTELDAYCGRLDWQIVRFLENLTYEAYSEDRQAELRDAGRDLFHPWSEAHAAILRLAEEGAGPVR